MVFAFDFVKQLDVAQGLFGGLAVVGGVQFEELATRLGHAADLGDAERRRPLFDEFCRAVGLIGTINHLQRYLNNSDRLTT